jgi:hypothetical protein
MFTEQIAACIEHDNKRKYLKGLPLTLIASTEYEPGEFYWLEFNKWFSN